MAALVLTTAALWPLRYTVGLLNAGLVYLVIVVGATIFAGQKAGIMASLTGFLMFNYFLVSPHLTFAVSDVENIFALFVFLGVSLLISWLLSRERAQAQHAQRRADDVSRLYELSQAIIGAQRIDEVLPAIAKKVYEVFQAQACWILLPDSRQQLVVQAQAPAHAQEPTRDEMSLAMWSYLHGSEIGKGGMDRSVSREGRNALRAGNENENKRAAYVPLRAAGRTIGVLAVADKKDNQPFTPAERTVLATFADQAAVALDRLSLLKEAQRAELLARTDELKSALMSAVSHDLRTPLTSIMASVTSLLEPGIDWDEDTERDFLMGIYDEARRLNRLVDNLLDMSRIEGGALHPEQDWYPISEVIEAVAQRLEARLADHPTTLTVDESIPLLLFDFTQIDQVLTNLIENAIKYTSPRTPIHIEARRNEGQVEVSVGDTGPGVPSEHLKHLFDKFYRVDKRGESSGTGLGLAIAKGFVEAHGGRIWAGNSPGGGLKVTFTLPSLASQNGVLNTLGRATAGSKIDG